MIPLIHHQLHGYRSGHQLLRSSVRLDRRDQELIDRLSDMAGPLRPGETFSPYLSCYPLPSEEYYVLSRTRQDLEAPRAGCVITQTILIPMNYWESEVNLSSLIEILDTDISGDAPIVSDESSPVPLPVVNGNFLPELLEALFLEKRSPIVVFAAEQVEALTVRLLSALWPAMRKKFSVCTHSLAPRMLMGRPFDLLFAPKAARSRFTEWSGRRVDASGKETQARHRWTSALIHRVCESQNPSLMSPEAKRLLAKGKGDESALRLTLLWEELLEKSESSPAAALGLLDIANSKGVLQESWRSIEPNLLRALDSTIAKTSKESAWAFVRDMATKIIELPSSLISPVLDKTLILAQQDIGAALSSLNSITAPSLLPSNQLFDSIAQSINSNNLRSISPALSNLEPLWLLRIFRFNPKLLNLVASHLDNSSSELVFSKLTDAVRKIGIQHRPTYLHIFAQHIQSKSQAKLLAELLRDLPTHLIIEAARTIWHVSQATVLGAVLCNEAMHTDAAEPVRDVFAERYNGNDTLEIILKLTNYSQIDCKWILTSPANKEFRGELIRSYVNNAQTKQLAAAFASRSLIEPAIAILIRSAKQNSKLIAVLLSLKASDAKTSIKIASRILAHLSSTEQKNLLGSLTSKILADSSLIYYLIPEMVATFPKHLTLEMLLNEGKGHNTRHLDLDELLRALDMVDSPNLDISNLNLYFLVDWLTNSTPMLSEGAASILSKILDNISLSNYSEYEQLALELLPSLMTNYKSSTSALIVKVFPSVYEMLRKEDSGIKFSRIFSFTDWDKCKTARKGLVRSFLRSDWPPVDLVKTAYYAQDTRRILKDLLQESGGKEYLKLIKNDIQKLPPEYRRAIINDIRWLGRGGF